jgi:hypothetical protein
VGTGALVATALAVGGLPLVLKLDSDPFVTITFPYDMVRQDIVDYINERLGDEIASLDANVLVLGGSRRVEIDDVASSAVLLGLLQISTYDTDHDERGEYVIVGVQATVLSLSTFTPLSGGPPVSRTHYRIKRYVQRISSTEMNENLDASGLYYMDVQLVSQVSGDIGNLGAGTAMTVTGHRSDGYRLTTDNVALSYSRAEVLRAEISPSILLVGSSDSPSEYVQLAQQNVQVAYDRSQIADDIQGFCDSDFQRVVCEEILVRHLLPHYVSLSWAYVGGSTEPEMLRAVLELLDALEPDQQFEVGDVVDVLRRKGALSVYTPDSAAQSGRSSPLFVIVHHEMDRSVRAQVVTDFVDTVRVQRYLPGDITLRRVSTGGIR